MVGVQAVLNVMSGERYSNVPSELPRYASGYYGQIPGEVDPDIFAQIVPQDLDSAIDFTVPDKELAKLQASRPELSDEDLLLRLFFGESTIDSYLEDPQDPNPALIAKSPLTELIKEAILRRNAHTFSVRTNRNEDQGLTYKDVKEASAYMAATPGAENLDIAHDGLHISVTR